MNWACEKIRKDGNCVINGEVCPKLMGEPSCKVDDILNDMVNHPSQYTNRKEEEKLNADGQ